MRKNEQIFLTEELQIINAEIVDSCWYMAKPIQYCKVKNKIKLKK